MSWKIVACFEDPLRPSRAFPWGFFDLVREPIWQGARLEIGFSPRSGRNHHLAPTYDPARFAELVGPDQKDGAWERHYFAVPSRALEYLHDSILPGTLIISFEMPPWLAMACTAWDVDFIDIRPSPLRFARDLYVALRTNNPSIYERFADRVVCEEEIRLEAAYLAAMVKIQQRRLEDAGRHTFDLAGTLIFVGQVSYDASIINPNGIPLRCSDFRDQLRDAAKGRRLLYKPHPFAGSFADEERLALQSIVGRDVENCLQNAYQILSTDDPIELIGISSALLQEAAYFDKSAHTLYRPHVPLAARGAPDVEKYQQVHFEEFLAPGFWHDVLSPGLPNPRVDRVSSLQVNHGRELLDQWWDYSKCMVWERSLWIEAFDRSGGGALRQRIERLESLMRGVPT